MPDKGKDRRTPEEVAEHYKQKVIRHEARDRVHAEAKAARIEKKYKDKAERADRAKAKRQSNRSNWSEKALQQQKKGRWSVPPMDMSKYHPWDL